MKIAGIIMTVLGVIIFFRVLQYGFDIFWAFPILAIGILLLVLDYNEKKR